MFEYNGECYDLKYNIKRIEMAENIIKKPMMSVIRQGDMSMSELTVIFSCGLKKEGSDSFLPKKEAIAITEKMLNAPGGYYDLADKVGTAIERDCPFFFPAG